jgi:hypothetical protein
MQALEAARLETAAAWEQDGQASGAVRAIIGAVDAPFLARLILVFMDLSTGSLLLEQVADDRTSATWKALVDERLKVLGTGVLSLVSDRANAFIQLAEQGLEGLRMPDFLPVVHESVKRYALAMGRHLRPAPQALQKAQEVLARLQGRPHADQDDPEATALVEASQVVGQQWEEGQRPSRPHLETLSLTRHPFRLSDATPQTSDQVASRWQAAGEAIEAWARRHQLPVRPHAIQQVRTPFPALAALVDCWWAGGRRDVAQAALSPTWQQWAQESLLPWVDWEHQGARTRCARRRAMLRQALEAVQVPVAHHALTARLPPQALQAWQAGATHRVSALQRASSAVEGRNGFLSQLHHHQRGFPTQRDKVWMVLHHFAGHAPDGTTPAARFFRRTVPTLFETVLSPIESLPRPRQRKHEVALSH